MKTKQHPCDIECPAIGNLGRACGLPEYPDIKKMYEQGEVWKCHSFDRVCTCSLGFMGDNENPEDFKIIDDMEAWIDEN